MIKRIDLFMPPTSQYGVLHHFTKKLCEALIRTGISCRLLQAQRTNPRPFLTEIFNDPPDCTLSFNGLLPDEDGRFFCDMIQIPHVACLVDSPNHFFDLIKSPYSIITCADRFSCEFFQGLNFQRVLFMPHGVEKHLHANVPDRRPYDVMMLSSCIDYEENRKKWDQKFPQGLCKVLDEAAEIALADQETPYVTAFALAIDRQVGKPGGVDPTQIPLVDALDELENYIRGKDRVELVKAIKDARVDIFGSTLGTANWQRYLGNRSNYVFHDPVSYEEALDLMKQSKIILNSCPWIKNGAHERIFAGLACGSCVITNENIYMRENFKDDDSIVFYQHMHWDKVNDRINQILSDPHKREKIVEKGREIVMRRHTWDHRAASLVKELDLILKRVH